MTLAEFYATNPIERWRSLPVASQEKIGALAVQWAFAELVAQDDGSHTTKADRDEAQAISDGSFEAVVPAVEAAFPDVMWFWPEGTEYVAVDQHGCVVGTIVSVMPVGNALTAHRYVAAGQEPGPVVDGKPGDCLPADFVAAGGTWRAALPQPGETA